MRATSDNASKQAPRRVPPKAACPAVSFAQEEPHSDTLTHVHICTHTNTYACAHARMSACTERKRAHTQRHKSKYIHMPTNIHTFTHNIYIYIYTQTCIYIYIHIYICIKIDLSVISIHRRGINTTKDQVSLVTFRGALVLLWLQSPREGEVLLYYTCWPTQTRLRCFPLRSMIATEKPETK